MIGDGPRRRPLEHLAAELGVSDRVRFLGQLDNPDARARAAACDLFVMPGVEEPFGVAFVEAMAAGLPAIGSRGEGGPEDIAAAGPGMVLVEPDDPGALAAVLDRLTGDRSRARAAGRRRRARRWRRTSPGSGAASRRSRRTARRSSPAPLGLDRPGRRAGAVARHHTRAAPRRRAARGDAARGRGVGRSGGDIDRTDERATAGVPGQRRGRGGCGAARAGRRATPAQAAVRRVLHHDGGAARR